MSVAILALTLLGSAANAVYAPFECQLALLDHARQADGFVRWSRLGAIDDGGDATILVRASGMDQTIVLNAGSGLRRFAQVTFGDQGHTYDLIHGPIARLKASRNLIAALNHGRHLEFQILDRDPPPPTSIGREVTWRLPGAARLARPFLALDAWLARSAAYRASRGWLDRRTRAVRDRIANALRARRNPRPAVAPPLLREVREWAAPGWYARVDGREDMIFRRLRAFFTARVPGVSLTEPGALRVITANLLEQIAPERADENAAALARSRLGQWRFTEPRATRLAMLGEAFALLASRVWDDEGPPAFTMFEIERTLARFGQIMAEPRDEALAWFASAEWRPVSPLTRVRGPNDFTWLVVTADHGWRLGPTKLIGALEAAGGVTLTGRLRDAVERLAIGYADRAPLLKPDADATLETLLVHQAVSGEVARVSIGWGRQAWIVPLPLRPTVVFAANLGEAPALADFVRENAVLAGEESDGRRRLIYHDDRGAWAVDFTLKAVERSRAVATIEGIQPASTRDQRTHWRRLAARWNLPKFEVEYAGRQPGFVRDGRVIERIFVEADALAESRARFGFDPGRAREVIASCVAATVDAATGCARTWSGGQMFEVCLIGGLPPNWMRLRHIRAIAP